jgi:hypothetical protein
MLLDGADAHECLDDVALPLFYLQRHTIELAIKTVIDAMLELRELEELTQIRDEDTWRKRVDEPAPRRETLTHALGPLIATMSSLLDAAKVEGRASLVKELTEIGGIVEAFEQDHPERARYQEVIARGKSRSKQRLASLPGPGEVRLPLGALQDRIDCLLAGPLRCESTSDGSLLAELAMEAAALSQRLYEMGRL